MIYGDPQNDRINLNDDTLWSGYPRDDRFPKKGYEALEAAKKHLLNKEYVRARGELKEGFTCYASETFLPLGDIKITAKNAGHKVRNYKRCLDLKHAVVTVTYTKGNVFYSTTAFASHPDHAIIYRMEAHGSDGAPVPELAFTVSVCSQLYAKIYTDHALLCMEGECPVTSEQNRDWTDRTVQYYDEPEKRGVRFMAIADIQTDGKKYDKMNAISVKGASYCEIRMYMATSFNGYDKHPFTEGRDYRTICRTMCETLSQKSFDEILKAHIKDHSRFFNRMKLDLGSDNRSGIPTSERLKRYEAGEKDRALPALLFNFGRYLTIASSRKGSQATNLQGIWNDQYAAPWHSNYTLNINTEMNYFPTLAIGLSEMYEPLIHLIQELSVAGKETAKVLYHADGWCCHHNTDLWRHTQPVAGEPVWSFWNMAGGWLCHHLMEYYEYTLDTSFLRKTAYPIMKEAVRFYLSQLITMDGYRIVFPSTSPENSFVIDGKGVPVAETTEMTMAIVRELFANYLKVGAILGIEDDVTASVKKELPFLLPTRISSDGRIMEWYREHTEREINHRHVSHLYAFFPGDAYRPDTHPELCAACRRSLTVRGDDGTGWSLAWKASLYARLWDGDKAYEFIKKQLRLTTNTGYDNNFGGGVYTNLFGSCPPFQIDSSFGTPAAIAEMLLQCDADMVHIIPALPKEWNNIRVSGLRAKGKRTVSFTVRDGVLTECHITGSKPAKIWIAGKEASSLFTETEKGCTLIG